MKRRRRVSVSCFSLTNHRLVLDFERRGIMQTMEHPIAGPFKIPGWPVRFGGRTPDLKPSPLLGQHTSEVLSEWLGLDANQIDQLGKDTII